MSKHLKRSHSFGDEEEEGLYKKDKKGGNLLLQNLHRNYSLKENWSCKQATASDDLCIVILGKTGVGKSATANTILGKSVFKEDFTSASVTTRSACFTRRIHDRKISVIDTPGLQDSYRPEDEVLYEIARVVQLFRKGIHVFVYVLNLADPRFTKEDKKAMVAIEMMFGGKMKRHRLLVYTHAESHLKNTLSLDKFLHKQVFHETLTGDFLKSLDGNIVAVNNKGEIDGERERNQSVILAMIDKIKEENNNKVYTNDMFKKAKTMWDECNKSLQTNGFNLTISGTIEMVIGEYPDTATDIPKLKRKVREKIEEELKQLENTEFNFSMNHVKEELNSIPEKTQSDKGKGKYAKNITKSIEEKQNLVASVDLDNQINEIAQTQDSYFKQLVNYLKSKWNSLLY